MCYTTSDILLLATILLPLDFLIVLMYIQVHPTTRLRLGSISVYSLHYCTTRTLPPPLRQEGSQTLE